MSLFDEIDSLERAGNVFGGVGSSILGVSIEVNAIASDDLTLYAQAFAFGLCAILVGIGLVFISHGLDPEREDSADVGEVIEA